MRTLILFIALVLCSFIANEEKKLRVELTQTQWDHHFRKLSTVRTYIEETNLPHADVKFIEGTIDSLLLDLYPQLIKQVNDTTKQKK